MSHMQRHMRPYANSELDQAICTNTAENWIMKIASSSPTTGIPIKYLVNIEEHSSSCPVSRAMDSPCLHRCAVIIGTLKKSPQLYTKLFYDVTAFRATYARAICHSDSAVNFNLLLQFLLPLNNSVPDNDIPHDNVFHLSPSTRKLPGRLVKRRLRPLKAVLPPNRTNTESARIGSNRTAILTLHNRIESNPNRIL
jgi:hypothetical protein